VPNTFQIIVGVKLARNRVAVEKLARGNCAEKLSL
jgi:hypothetical protein